MSINNTISKCQPTNAISKVNQEIQYLNSNNNTISKCQPTNTITKPNNNIQSQITIQ